ncbi:MAG: argS [Ilumatobacteraceae bacterium]|nr:argS [Ilumatobacteraceae bacterium]
MADPIVTVAELLQPAFAAVGGAGADPVVRPSDRADAQANGALAIAKQLGQNPRQVAEAVLAVAGPVLETICSHVEIAGPGFLNLTFSDGFLAEQLGIAAADERLGVRSAPITKRIVIDYSAPNVAKEMHVGHLRTTVIGDALVRLLTFVGHTVIRENHIGDWGTPFGMLIEHLVDLGETEAFSELSVGDLDVFYKQARGKFDADPAIQDRARQRVVLLQSGDPETMRLWHLLVEQSTKHFNAVYAKLGVLLTDDDIAGESMYNPLLPEVLERLDAAGLLEQSDGADVVFPPGFTNREGAPLPLIVQKRGGGFNYGTSDLACVIDRVERVKGDVLLYVVGAPQAQHFAMVFKVAEMAGWLHPPTEAVHVMFGNVLGPDRKMLKSRSGEPLKFIELLDEAVLRAAAAVAEKNPDLAADEQADIAHIIGIGAVKYSDLSTDRIKDYIFDWDRMLAFDGNTAPYLQYAHARICSIFRRAEIDRASVRGAAVVLGVLQERVLARRLLAFDSAVWDTIDKYSPHRLCTYLFDLAQDFTAFYEHCPVLKADDEATKHSRLALCDTTARVLSAGLDLLGIVAPERM